MVISIAFQEVSLSEKEGGTLQRGATTRLQYTFQNKTNLTFRLCVAKGRIIIYVSSIPNPSSAQYDERDEINRNPFFPITCLTKVYYQINGGKSNIFGGQTTSVGNSYQNGRRKRRQTTTEPEFAPAIYIILEGQDDINEFNFNSSEGNVTFGRCIWSSS